MLGTHIGQCCPTFVCCVSHLFFAQELLVQIASVIEQNKHAERRMDKHDGPTGLFLFAFMQICTNVLWKDNADLYNSKLFCSSKTSFDILLQRVLPQKYTFALVVLDFISHIRFGCFIFVSVFRYSFVVQLFVKVEILEEVPKNKIYEVSIPSINWHRKLGPTLFRVFIFSGFCPLQYFFQKFQYFFKHFSAFFANHQNRSYFSLRELAMSSGWTRCQCNYSNFMTTVLS